MAARAAARLCRQRGLDHAVDTGIHYACQLVFIAQPRRVAQRALAANGTIVWPVADVGCERTQ